MATTLILRTGYVENSSSGAYITRTELNFNSPEEAVRDFGLLIKEYHDKNHKTTFEYLMEKEQLCCTKTKESSSGVIYCSKCGHKLLQNPRPTTTDQIRTVVETLVSGTADCVAHLYWHLEARHWNPTNVPKGKVYIVYRAEEVIPALLEVEDWQRPWDTWEAADNISSFTVESKIP